MVYCKYWRSDIANMKTEREVHYMDKWEFYKDTEGLWRWRRIAANGRIVGSSSQGYVNKSDCIDNATRNGYKG